MKPAFWIKRFFFVFIGVFLVLLIVNVLKSGLLGKAAKESAIWAAAAAVVFVCARIYQSRKGQHCALCRDTPEMAKDGRETVSTPSHTKK